MFLHVVLLTIEIITIIITQVYNFRNKKVQADEEANECMKTKADMDLIWALLVQETYNNGVDVFFLYLIYRFSKRCQAEGEDQTMQSGIFAHNLD